MLVAGVERRVQALDERRGPLLGVGSEPRKWSRTQNDDAMSTVGAVADDRGGQTKCTYEVGGDEIGGAYAEVQLNWGDGESGMMGAGIMEPELGSVMGKLALGDQATSVGPMILIRRGSDLITLVISGVPDSNDAAKRIYDLLDARLPKAAAP